MHHTSTTKTIKAKMNRIMSAGFAVIILEQAFPIKSDFRIYYSNEIAI